MKIFLCVLAALAAGGMAAGYRNGTVASIENALNWGMGGLVVLIATGLLAYWFGGDLIWAWEIRKIIKETEPDIRPTLQLVKAEEVDIPVQRASKEVVK